jgi:DNA ligase-1
LDALISEAKATRSGIDLDALMARAQKRSSSGGVSAQTLHTDTIRLEHTAGAHYKFWEGWVRDDGAGATFLARWGKIGTAGQSGSWSFATLEQAQKKLNQKVREKKNKGYQQVGAPSVQQWSPSPGQQAPQTISVMLAKVWSGDDPTGWHMSEKLDGMRAYWTGERMLTRNGNPIHIPDWLRAVLPPTALDGELWLGRGKLREVISVARKSSPRDPRWASVRYMVFDAPAVSGGCERRFTELRKLVKAACRKWRALPRGQRPRLGQGRGTLDCPVEFVEQTVCRSRAQLDRLHSQITSRGGEGVMLRRPRSPYTRSRTSDLLKVIERQRAEAQVVGHAQGTGRNRGRLGAYRARLLDTGVEFRVGTGIRDDERQDPVPLGTIITVQYKGLNPSGKPREPSYVGPRDE